MSRDGMADRKPYWRSLNRLDHLGGNPSPLFERSYASLLDFLAKSLVVLDRLQETSRPSRSDRTH